MISSLWPFCVWGFTADLSPLSTLVQGTVSGHLRSTGLAPESKFMACRGISLSGTGTLQGYMDCAQFMLAPFNLKRENPSPTLAPDIVLSAYTCDVCATNSLLQSYDAFRAAGIAAISESGIHNPKTDGDVCSSQKHVPSIYESVYTIGAQNMQDAPCNVTIANFSPQGPVTVDGSGRMKPNMVAFGTRVLSTVAANAYVTASGTSMASAVFAGGVALMWSAVPELKGQLDLTYGIFEDTADAGETSDCMGDGASPNNVYGHGALNVERAVVKAIKKIRGKRCFRCLKPCFELTGAAQQRCQRRCDLFICIRCAQRTIRKISLEARLASRQECLRECAGRNGWECKQCVRRVKRTSNKLARKVTWLSENCM